MLSDKEKEKNFEVLLKGSDEDWYEFLSKLDEKEEMRGYISS